MIFKTTAFVYPSELNFKIKNRWYDFKKNVKTKRFPPSSNANITLSNSSDEIKQNCKQLCKFHVTLSLSSANFHVNIIKHYFDLHQTAFFTLETKVNFAPCSSAQRNSLLYFLYSLSAIALSHLRVHKIIGD